MIQAIDAPFCWTGVTRGDLSDPRRGSTGRLSRSAIVFARDGLAHYSKTSPFQQHRTTRHIGALPEVMLPAPEGRFEASLYCIRPCIGPLPPGREDAASRTRLTTTVLRKGDIFMPNSTSADSLENQFNADRPLSVKQAAAFLSLHPRTLDNWRSQKRGPRYRRVGSRKVVYLARDLREYMDGGIVEGDRP